MATAPTTNPIAAPSGPAVASTVPSTINQATPTMVPMPSVNRWRRLSDFLSPPEMAASGNDASAMVPAVSVTLLIAHPR